MTSPALRLYRAAARLAPVAWSEATPRPDGPLLWAHADDPARLPALAALAARLSGEGVAALLTVPPGDRPAEARPATGAPLRPAPPERAARAFLAHWRPDLLVWVGGRLRPGLIAGAPCPRLLVEGAPRGRLLSHGGWLPGLAAAVVPAFDRALVAGPEAAARLRRAGLPEARIEVAPPLDAPPPVLPCNERERRDLAQTFGSRPVWLAADLPPAEAAAVAAAQARASRSAHRLLLIVAPRAPEEAAALGAALAAAGLRVAARAEGEEPDESHQAYLADGPAEMGLWLRLAPLTFLGGTLAGGPGGRHPFEAAALGSALVHGPRTAPHDGPWARLHAAGAARLVRNAVELGQAVEACLAPDRVALMAQGAWDVATQGAEAANLVEALARERLFGPGGPGGPA